MTIMIFRMMIIWGINNGNDDDDDGDDDDDDDDGDEPHVQESHDLGAN